MTWLQSRRDAVVKYLKGLYFHWKICTCLEILEPEEAIVFYIVFLLFLGTILYACVTYLPAYVTSVLHL